MTYRGALTLCLGIFVGTSACSPALQNGTAKRNRLRDSLLAMESPAYTLGKVGHPPQLKRYLENVHKRLTEPWNVGVRKRADEWLPKDHPANNQRLAATIALKVDPNGKLSGIKLISLSGYRAFDNSALKAAKMVTNLPPLPPGLDESHVTLLWTFFRDARGCSPAYVNVVAKPLPPAQALALVLSRGRYQRAQEILNEAGADPAVLEVIAEQGLKSPAVSIQAMAASIAPDQMLVALLQNGATSDSLWLTALDVLTRRRDTKSLASVVSETVTPQSYTPKNASAVTAKQVSRLVLVMDRLNSLNGSLKPATIRAMLGTAIPAWVTAAVSLSNAAQLAKLLDNPLLAKLTKADVLRATSVASGQIDKQMLIAALLSGSHTAAVLETLQRFPVASASRDISHLVKDKSQPLAIRASAIRALAATRDGVGTLYYAATDSVPQLQIAAAKALAVFPGSPLAASYRLAQAAYHGEGDVSAEAVVSMAKIGHKRMLTDLSLLIRRLQPNDRARVVPYFAAAYGVDAIPLLRWMLKQDNADLHRAAYQALLGINHPDAQKALASVEPPAQATPKKQTASSKKPSLETLLRAAVAVASTPATSIKPVTTANVGSILPE